MNARTCDARQYRHLKTLRARRCQLLGGDEGKGLNINFNLSDLPASTPALRLPRYIAATLFHHARHEQRA